MGVRERFRRCGGREGLDVEKGRRTGMIEEVCGTDSWKKSGDEKGGFFL